MAIVRMLREAYVGAVVEVSREEHRRIHAWQINPARSLWLGGRTENECRARGGRTYELNLSSKMVGLALRGIDHAWQNLERRLSYPPRRVPLAHGLRRKGWRGAGGVRRPVDHSRGCALHRRRRNTLDQVQTRRFHAPPARPEIPRYGDCPTRCFESILLAKRVRVGISRSRERGDVRRQARAQRRACSRPARGHRVARPTAGVVTPDGAVPLLAGPPGCPKAASARSSVPNRQRSSCDKASRSPTPFTRSAISINRI